MHCWIRKSGRGNGLFLERSKWRLKDGEGAGRNRENRRCEVGVLSGLLVGLEWPLPIDRGANSQNPGGE